MFRRLPKLNTTDDLSPSSAPIFLRRSVTDLLPKTNREGYHSNNLRPSDASNVVPDVQWDRVAECRREESHERGHGDTYWGEVEFH